MSTMWLYYCNKKPNKNLLTKLRYKVSICLGVYGTLIINNLEQKIQLYFITQNNFIQHQMTYEILRTHRNQLIQQPFSHDHKIVKLKGTTRKNTEDICTS